MAIQQLADINLGGTKQAGVDHKTKSRELSADKPQDSTPFKDQIKKHMDQAKSDSKHEKNSNNQQLDDKVADRSADDSTVDTAVQTVEPSDVDTTVDAAASDSEGSDLNIEKELNAFTNMLNGVLSATESVESNVMDDATVLPEVGKQLPPAAAVIAQVVSQQQAPVQEGPAVQQVVAAQLKSVTSTQQTVVGATNVGADVDLSAVDLKALRPINVTDKPDFFSSQTVVAKGEVSTAEIIASATRLQQVPMSTSVSNSLSAAQNVHTTAIDTALPATSGTVLNNSLSAAIDAHLQSPDWSRQMTDQVSFMAKGGFQQAEIKLNPAHLGPMEIKLSVSDDRASVNFVTHHAPVRDAIDAAIPRLREMLEQQGLSLDVNVSTQSEQQQANEDLQNSGGAGFNPDTSEQSVDASTQDVIIPLNMEVDSGVNLYA